ncbi:unnamed protein product [marine sediment metagenome]|uniref:Aspartate racemase n=1 Tax=marine sediment metagenome TaxID=412755 RepID=X1E7D8_9ZZZZ
MVKHIGIVACSAEGAALCYKTICIEGENFMGRYGHPEVTMHTHSLSEYIRYIETGDWESVANLMLSSVNKLTKIGVDFAICPDNTIHQAFDLVIKKSPIPWIHIADSVIDEAKNKNYKCLGVLNQQSKQPKHGFISFFIRNIFSITPPASFTPFENSLTIIWVLPLLPRGLPLNTVIFISRESLNLDIKPFLW